MFTSWETFVDEVHNWQGANRDEMCEVRELVYQGENQLGFGRFDKLWKSNVFEVGNLTEHATNQICSRMNIPAKWFKGENCPTELRQMVANWKFQNVEEKDYLVRLRGDDDPLVRAFLSDKYAIFDHKEFLDAIVEAVHLLGGNFKVHRPQVGDYMRAYLIDDRFQFDSPSTPWYRPEDNGNGSGGINPGVYISNNEVGLGRTIIAPATFRLVCINGMYRLTKEEGFQVVHRGSRKHNTLAINTAIKESFKMSEELGIKFLEAQTVYIEPDRVEDLVDSWTTKYGIIEQIATDAKGDLKYNENPTWFDVINKMTHMARFQEPDMRADMERMAGDMVYANLRPADVQNWR